MGHMNTGICPDGINVDRRGYFHPLEPCFSNIVQASTNFVPEHGGEFYRYERVNGNLDRNFYMPRGDRLTSANRTHDHSNRQYVNFQHASSSSSLDTWQHPDSQYASVRNRSSSAARGVEPDNYNRVDQPFAPSGAVWFDRTVGGVTSARTPIPNPPYLHGGNNIIPTETVDMTQLRYHETANNTTSAPINFHHVPGSRGRNINFNSPSPASHRRIPTTRSTRDEILNVTAPVSNAPASNAPAGHLRIPQPQRTGVDPLSPELRDQLILPDLVDLHRIPPYYVSNAPDGRRTLSWPQQATEAMDPRLIPHLRFVDGFAILDVSPYNESAYQHRDVDIEHMSYEELFALEERIGSVNTGLSEEKINRQLKTRTYVSSEQDDQDSYPCIICQEEYKKKEKIGILNCGHEYHADCLTKWLLVKNACPICKSQGVG